MANPAAELVAGVAILAAAAAARIDAAPGPEVVLVLHMTDEAHVSAGVLAEAEKQVTRVYYAAGVRARWINGAAQTTPPDDGAFHVDVFIRSMDMKDGTRQSEGIAGEVLGRALRPIRRAYVFYDRVYDHAMLTGSNVARLLGAVIAHEVGHLLLPAFSHSTDGIMREHWDGRITRVPDFTADQGHAIRTRLADSCTK